MSPRWEYSVTGLGFSYWTSCNAVLMEYVRIQNTWLKILYSYCLGEWGVLYFLYKLSLQLDSNCALGSQGPLKNPASFVTCIILWIPSSQPSLTALIECCLRQYNYSAAENYAFSLKPFKVAVLVNMTDRVTNFDPSPLEQWPECRGQNSLLLACLPISSCTFFSFFSQRLIVWWI